ncbi:hypothetical protein GCM10017687_27660 [Streptomyces echinatus]
MAIQPQLDALVATAPPQPAETHAAGPAECVVPGDVEGRACQRHQVTSRDGSCAITGPHQPVQVPQGGPVTAGNQVRVNVDTMDSVVSYVRRGWAVRLAPRAAAEAVT